MFVVCVWIISLSVYVRPMCVVKVSINVRVVCDCGAREVCGVCVPPYYMCMCVLVLWVSVVRVTLVCLLTYGCMLSVLRMSMCNVR